MGSPRAGRRLLPRAIAAAMVVTTLVGLAACSDDKGDDAPPSTTTIPFPTTSSTAAAAGSSTTAGAKVGCPATHDGGIPPGFASRAMADLDGDGKVDTLYVGAGDGGIRRFGVVTASGSRSEWTVANASPVDPSIYGIVDADADGRPEVFVNPGRIVYVLVLADCKLQPYLNKDGDPYGFSVGFGEIGTGVGCIDADGDGHRDLVGLDEKPAGNGKIEWSRTIVTLHGTQARNGATSKGTYTSPADDAKITLLDEVTCGDNSFPDPLVSNQG